MANRLVSYDLSLGHDTLLATNADIAVATITGPTDTTINITPTGTGTVQVNGDLTITGSETIQQNVTYQGNTTIGSDADDDLTINAELLSSLVPNTDGSINVGSSTKAFAVVYTDAITTTTGTNLAIDVLNASADSTLAIGNSDGTYDCNVTMDGDLTVAGAVTLASVSVTGATTLNGTVGLGDDPADNISFNGVLATNITPAADSTYSIGAPATAFQYVYTDAVVTTDGTTLTLDAVNSSADSTLAIGNSDATYACNVTMDGDLAVSGDLTVTGATTLNGAVTLGDGAGDNVTFSGVLASSITPGADGSYSVGTATVALANVYTDAITTTDGTTLTVDVLNSAAASTLAIGNSDGTYACNVTMDGGLTVSGTTALAGASFSGTADFNSVVDVAGATVTGTVTPTTDSTYDLGADATRWANVYADTYYGDGSNLTGISVSDTITITGAEVGGIALNDICYFSANATMKLAINTSKAAASATAIANEAIANTASGEVSLTGQHAVNFIAALSVTAGDSCYVSGTAGKATNDISGFGSGTYVTHIGYISDATEYAGDTRCDVVMGFAAPIYIA